MSASIYAVLLLVNADVDQCAVEVFLAEFLQGGGKAMHRSRDRVAKVANHVVDHFRDQKVVLDDENARREKSSREIEALMRFPMFVE